MAEILQHADFTVSGNASKSSQKMASLCSTDLLSHPRRFLPAAFTAPHRNVIGSSSPDKGGDRNGVSKQLIFQCISPALGGGGGQASWDSCRCGAHEGHPASQARPAERSTQHPARAPATPPCHLQHLEGGLALPGRPPPAASA